MLGVSALVTTLVLAVGALSIYTMSSYVATVSDTQLTHSLTALDNAYTKARAGDTARSLTGFTGQAPGTVIAVMRGGVITRSAMFDDDGPRRTPADVVTDLQSMSWQTDAPRTVDLGSLGHYRAAAVHRADGTTLISAISLAGAEHVIIKKIVAVAVITAVAAVLAALGTVLVVRQALRPLRRVAATAARAARMPLADSDRRITARVRRADSNPDNEVGVVGETLNRLLANVDSALAARRESDRRMRRFLSDASHELRTPLAAIHGYAQLTRQDAERLPESTEYALARIEAESRRMSRLIEDMLLLSRFDEGRELEMELIDLCALTADAINDASVTAPDHRYTADLPADAVWVRGDHAALQQVVGNLLANARVHTPAGTTVTTAVRQDGDVVELAVIDDGPGIDPEIMPYLFDRFVRASKARSREMGSTGLGLAIVKAITAAHGGSVSATSEPGRTELLVRLPRVDIDVAHELSFDVDAPTPDRC